MVTAGRADANNVAGGTVQLTGGLGASTGGGAGGMVSGNELLEII